MANQHDIGEAVQAVVTGATLAIGGILAIKRIVSQTRVEHDAPYARRISHQPTRKSKRQRRQRLYNSTPR